MSLIFEMSRHATVRAAQRNLSDDDLALAMHIGTEVLDGFLVRERDVQSYVCELKRQIDRAERLSGVRIVSDGVSLVTAYHADRSKQRRLLRR
jgi:hypothetical protein